jgi:hypothetical protein
MLALSSFSLKLFLLLWLSLAILFLPSLSFSGDSILDLPTDFSLSKSASIWGEPIPVEDRRVWEMLEGGKP